MVSTGTGAPEPLILALETSGDVCSVAVQRGGQFIAEHRFRHAMHLSERLIGHIEAVLRDAEAALSDVTLFAVGIGPGSFTGTRVGVMTAKTFAAILSRPIIGVGSLEALAAEYSGLEETLVVPLLPCRAGVVYAGAFRVGGMTPQTVLAPDAFPTGDLAESLFAQPLRQVLLCGSAASATAPTLREILASSGIRVSVGEAESPSAAQVARLAAIRVTEGGAPDDPVALVPHYISPPPITLPKKP